MVDVYPQLQQTEVDGVPTFWLTGISGPRRAALMSRVGRADEPLARSGITHLVEHLVLAPLGVQDYDHNGMVEDIRTMFMVMGSDEDIVEFYDGVTRGLAEPPLGRIEVERRILADEAAQRGGNIQGAIRWYRFGSQGHGQLGIDELGISWLGPDPVRDWAQTRFVREATALMMSGPPPPALKIPLPSGSRTPVPVVSPIRGISLPAQVGWDGPGVTMSLLIPRSPAAPLLAELIQRRARQRLRFDLGLLYDIHVDYAPLDRDVAHLTLGGDCQPQRVSEVRDELLGVLDALGTAGPTPEELEAAMRGFRSSLDDDDALLGYVDAMAFDHLLEFPVRPLDQIVAERSAVTPEEVAAALGENLDSLLVMAAGDSPTGNWPAGAGPVGERLARYPLWSESAVGGRTHAPAGLRMPWNRPKERLVAGPDGVSFLTPDGHPLTVRFADVVACVHPTEDERVLYGVDGFRVYVAAAAWENGAAIVTAIDQAISADLVACDTHGIGALAVSPEMTPA